MQNRLTAIRPVLDFTPVPRRARTDGWTPDRQRAFIEALAETGSVTAAALRINMAAFGAYRLRNAPGAESFRAAWDLAIDHGVQSLRDIAMERAREGVAQPIVSKGEIVGEKRVYDNRLLTFLIRRHDQLDGLAPGTKSDERVRQEAEALAVARVAELWAQKEAEEQAEADACRARLTARFELMEERMMGEYMEDWTEAEREAWKKDRQRGVAMPIRPVLDKE